MSSNNINGVQRKINEILQQKKLNDPAGLLKAQRDGCLAEYLMEDMLKARINPKDITFVNNSNSKDRKAVGSDSSGNHHANTNNGSTNASTLHLQKLLIEYSNLAANSVDKHLFDPYYEQNSTPFEKTVCEQISKWNLMVNYLAVPSTSPIENSFNKIKLKLQYAKLATLFGSVLSAYYCINCFNVKNQCNPLTLLMRCAIYGGASVDLLRISYNCYIKQYCTLVARKLAGNASALGNTLFQWISANMHAGSRETNTQDPFAVIKEKIMWDVVFTTDTYWYKIYAYVQDAIDRGRVQ